MWKDITDDMSIDARRNGFAYFRFEDTNETREVQLIEVGSPTITSSRQRELMSYAVGLFWCLCNTPRRSVEIPPQQRIEFLLQVFDRVLAVGFHDQHHERYETLEFINNNSAPNPGCELIVQAVNLRANEATNARLRNRLSDIWISVSAIAEILMHDTDSNHDQIKNHLQALLINVRDSRVLD